MKAINGKLIDETIEKARTSPRKRHSTEVSASYTDIVQRIINAIEPESYIRPHKHENPDKTETFLILRGKMAVVIFDDEGKIKYKYIIEKGGENLGLDILPRTWHSVVSLQSGSAILEVKQGPYDPATDKKFANWSPEENSVESGKYLSELKKHIMGD